MRNRANPMVGLAATALALCLTLTVSAGPLGPAHTTALVFKVGDLPSRTTLEYGWVGIGGDDNFTALIGGDDCFDLDGANGNPGGQQPLFVQVQWFDTPPVAQKKVGERVEIADEQEISDPLIDEACAQAGAATGGLVGTDPNPDFPPSDPQRIGHGDLAIRFEDVWFPVMDFDSGNFAVSATAVSCRVLQSPAPTFVSVVNRGVAELEPVMPAESLAGSALEGLCVDHTDTLGTGWASGTVNQFPGLSGPARYSCDIADDPDCGDMAPGLWATCITALIHDPIASTQGTESDYTWWWIEDANLALATQWSSMANWDGEEYRGEFTSQQDCSTLGDFQA